jgi:hypothetical protein
MVRVSLLSAPLTKTSEHCPALTLDCDAKPVQTPPTCATDGAVVFPPQALKHAATATSFRHFMLSVPPVVAASPGGFRRQPAHRIMAVVLTTGC